MTKIYRSMYLSQIKPQEITAFKKYLEENKDGFSSRLQSESVVSFALYSEDCLLFIYQESTRQDAAFIWESPFDQWLEQWPGQSRLRNVVPLMDVFHDAVPNELDEWRGERTINQRIGSLAYLQPEQYCSYVFYHYQLQEENPESFNKTYTIGAHENMLFSYHETPAPISINKPEGLLKTKHTPDNWQEVMLPHFQLEADGSKPVNVWKVLECIYVL